MPINKLTINAFILFAQDHLVLDVRSPGEYEHAHIPNAVSLPLFSDEERKIVGTAYKHESREKAIKIGLEFFGTKQVKLIEAVEKLVTEKNVSKEVGVHCWRGGMRSAAVAWLLDLYGFKVNLLTGGYKVYRNWALMQFEKNYPFHIVGGYTGSNKTGVLAELKMAGETIIDLEGLALHMGSAFGNLNLHLQPSQEMFENLLATELNKQSKTNTIIWVEDESQRLGNVNIPFNLYTNIRQHPVAFLNISFEERLKHIVEGYKKYSKEKIINAIVRIKKKLGGLETKNAINALIEDDLHTCFSILLNYYDKLYLKGTYNRKESETQIALIDLPTVNAKTNSKILIKYVNNR